MVRSHKEELRNQEKAKSAAKNGSHDRTKSYADALLDTPTNSKANKESGFSYRGHKSAKMSHQQFFSKQATPTNQKPTENRNSANLYRDK